jgi:hypothetical protein
VHGGQVIGGTDRTGASSRGLAYSPADVAATTYQALGIPLGAELHDRGIGRRPFWRRGGRYRGYCETVWESSSSLRHVLLREGTGAVTSAIGSEESNAGNSRRAAGFMPAVPVQPG